MKLTPVIFGLAAAFALSGCAQQFRNTYEVPNPDFAYSRLASQADMQKPHLSGNVVINQRLAVPQNAVLTVTLSDASRADAPAKVLSQKVVNLEGHQAPFGYVLPYDLADIRQNARILLSAAITVDGKLMFRSDSFKPVITNGVNSTDLDLIPLQNTAVAVQPAKVTEAYPVPTHFLPQQQQTQMQTGN
ncbi:YbaY family lipoprotein [Mangrovibacter yixingensis]|uniref:YbaY family lipoprotein n=1 Tax=Mangrovibacter yixingensis TaxID=1529639 RepID=UPI001CF9F58A|nr:YbaY family lipoprotein [Mangrovibacter yixingensis]